MFYLLGLGVATNTPCEVLLNSPKLSLYFPCKQVGRILIFISDSFLSMIICFILITKQIILCRLCGENLHTDKPAAAEKVK